MPPLLRLAFSGACCVHSTISDYARFLIAAMRDRGLSPAFAAQRFALPRDQMCGGEGIAIADCPARIGMGLGWMLFGYAEETVITHTGVNEGERAAAFFVPGRGTGSSASVGGPVGGAPTAQ